MEKKYQIFISSTFKDLEEERHQAIEAILDLNCIPISMEHFPATDMKQMDYIQMLLNDADFMIVIMGNCYGTTDAEGVSYTEREFEYAIKKNIPIIAFLNKEFAPKENPHKLRRFRERVRDGRVCNFWNTSDELKAKILSSLANNIRHNPPGGWVKAKDVDLYTLPPNIFFSDEEPINAKEGDVWIGKV